MIYSSLYPPNAVLTRDELTLQETRRAEADSFLLTATYATPGVVYGLNVGVTGQSATVSPGLAVVTDTDGKLHAVGVDRLQSVPVTQQGTTGVYLDPLAFVRLDPQIPPGQSTPVYMRSASLAFSASGLPFSEGVIDHTGLILAPVGALNDRFILLGVVTLFGSSLIEESYIAPQASVRGAVVGGGSTGGGSGTPSVITEAMLDSALVAKIDAALTRSGSPGLTGDLDAGGHALHSVSTLTGVGNAPVEGSITHLNGQTLAQVIAQAQSGMSSGGGTPAAPTVTIAPFTVSATIAMSTSLPAPRSLSACLPDGSTPAGFTYAAAFSGEGSLLNRSGLALTFAPAIRFGPDIPATWVTPGGSLFFGGVVGVSGSGGFFLASLVSRVSDTEVRHLLQRVLPGPVPSVTLFDSYSVAVVAADPTPAPNALSVAAGKLMWGTRDSGITLTAGDPSNPDTTTQSVWVRGYRLSRSDASGCAIQLGTLAVVGTVTLLSDPVAIPALAATPVTL